jgi:outer membrane protein assembly factor BamB
MSAHRMMRPLMTSALTVALLTSLTLSTGCSRGLKPEVHKPSKLPQLTAPVQSLSDVWHERIGGGDRKDPLRLQLASNQHIIIAANRDGDVTAWSVGSNKALWTRKLKRPVSAGVSLQDDMAVVGTETGQLIALNSKTGETLWQRQLTASVLAPALIAADRVVVLANDGTVTGTDRVTGQPVWSFDVPVPAISVRGSASPLLFDDNRVIVSSAGGRIYSLDLQSGVPQWEGRVAINQGRSDVQRLIDIDGTPLISGRQLYVVSYQGQLKAVDLDSQRVRWSMDTSSLRSPATGIGNIYVSTADGHIDAYDEQDGKVVWTQKKLAYRDLSNPVVLGRYLIVGDADGYLHLIEQTEGKIVGRVRTRGAVRSLRVVDDRLLVDSSTGHLSIWQVR